jgi:hypothetical protein
MPQKQSEQNIVFISELKHIDLLENFFNKHPTVREEGFVLIPLDLEIEYALKAKGIPFRSGGTYRTQEAITMTVSETWTASVFESKRWSFFDYRGVSLSQLYFVPLQGYLGYVIYCADIITNALATHTQAVRIIVFSASGGAPAMGSTLVSLQVRVFADTLECIAAQSGREAVVVSAPALLAAQFESMSFRFKRALFGIGIGMLNMLVTLFRRPRHTRVLASDYWRNLAPYAKCLGSLEIVLIDRNEALKAGLSNIWKFRMRFLHLDAFPNTSSEHMKEHDRIAGEFESLQKSKELSTFEFRGFSLQAMVLRALGLIVKEALGKTLKDIDNTHGMFEHVKPHIVLLRSTISNQTHFVILAQVARARGVPSLEVQHGLQYYGPGSFTRRHSAQYMAVYGSFTRREMQVAGDVRSTPVVIGSPRFDVYASMLKRKSQSPPKPPREKVSFLCIASAIEPVADADTYAYEEYFSAVAFAFGKIKNFKIIIKFRPGDNGRNSFARTLLASIFVGIPYTIAHNEPLSELFLDADVVISGYSTAAIEAMQCGKPLVFLALSSVEKLFGFHHFPLYVENNAIRLATTKESLADIAEELATHQDAREKLASQGVAFLEREYAFDGRASERMATFIRSLIGDK